MSLQAISLVLKELPKVCRGFLQSPSRTMRDGILRLRQYVVEHCGEDIDLDTAADIAAMSKSYLSTIFKRETGEGFRRFVNRVRVERARDLIESRGYKVYKAAEAVGFGDFSYFSRLYKRIYGTSPSKL